MLKAETDAESQNSMPKVKTQCRKSKLNAESRNSMPKVETNAKSEINDEL